MVVLLYIIHEGTITGTLIINLNLNREQYSYYKEHYQERLGKNKSKEYVKPNETKQE